MKRILVTYATFSGTTPDVARAVAEEFCNRNLQADIQPLDNVHSLDGYDAVVLGAPMIIGFHRHALDFLRKNREALRRMPLAIFVTAMSLTQPQETSLDGVPLTLDENLVALPKKAGHYSLKERYTNAANYASPILKAAGPARPVSLAFFGGRLDYYRLKWWAMLFVMLVIQAKPGDHRNWPAIRAWAGMLADRYLLC
jgi:menaquinone-dependent protoporphyrinogen IX oxidase